MEKRNLKTQPQKKGMKINGWAEEIRNLGGIKFIDLHTADGNYQITLVKKNTPEALF